MAWDENHDSLYDFTKQVYLQEMFHQRKHPSVHDWTEMMINALWKQFCTVVVKSKSLTPVGIWTWKSWTQWNIQNFKQDGLEEDGMSLKKDRIIMLTVLGKMDLISGKMEQQILYQNGIQVFGKME